MKNENRNSLRAGMHPNIHQTAIAFVRRGRKKRLTGAADCVQGLPPWCCEGRCFPLDPDTVWHAVNNFE